MSSTLWIVFDPQQEEKKERKGEREERKKEKKEGKEGRNTFVCVLITILLSLWEHWWFYLSYSHGYSDTTLFRGSLGHNLAIFFARQVNEHTSYFDIMAHFYSPVDSRTK